MPVITADTVSPAELEELHFTTEYLCTDCGSPDPTYHDRETGKYLCLECLEGAVDAETEKANAQEFDWLTLEQARLDREAFAPAFAAPFC